MSAVARYVRIALAARGMSESQLALKLDVDRSHLWKYIHGKRRLDKSTGKVTLSSVAAALDVPELALLVGQPCPACALAAHEHGAQKLHSATQNPSPVEPLQE